MANYFTHFSCLLDVGTPKNAARALDLYSRMMEANAAEDPPSDAFLLSIQPEHGGTQLLDSRRCYRRSADRDRLRAPMCRGIRPHWALGASNGQTRVRARA